MGLAAKSQKEVVPFRAIVTVKGSWHGPVFRFLQKQSDGLEFEEPFLVRNSQEVIGFFSEREATRDGLFVFSIDAEDLF